MKLIILAGGSGKRLADNENLVPKPLSDIGGKPLLWHIMKYFAYYGIKSFVICLGFKAKTIKKRMSDIPEIANGDWNVNFLNTGMESSKLQRIMQAAKYLDRGPNLLSYADNLCDFDVIEFIDNHVNSGKIFSLTGVRPHSPYGHIFRDDGVVTFKEKPEMRNSLINAGYMIFEPEFIDYISKFDGELETEVISALAKDSELNGD
ncbi:MAG: sugar phosphate nucleotidyltransferase [Clostridia bacterium]|nr:sugar phosphate nucleotidyltransferase [Clostridia bacterium]